VLFDALAVIKGRLWGAWYISAGLVALPLFLTGDDDLVYRPVTAIGQRKGDMAPGVLRRCMAWYTCLYLGNYMIQEE
jgi:hypothetical protein